MSSAALVPPAVAPSGERAATWRAFAGVVLFFLGLYGSTLHGYVDVEDTEIAYQGTRSLVERGSLAIADEGLGHDVITADYMVARGEDGRVYPRYPLAQLLLPVPLYALGRACAGLAHSQPEEVVRLGYAALNAIAGALLAGVIVLAARALGCRVRVAAAAALVAGAGTMLWAYAQGTFADLPLALANTVAVLGLVRSRQGAGAWALLAGLAQGGAGALRPIGFVLALPALLYLRGAGRMRVALYVVGCLGVGAAMTWLDAAVFGRPLTAGYLQRAAGGVLQPTHSYTLSVFGLTFSDGMGLFTLSPALLLAWPGLARLWRTHRREAALLLGESALLVALFAAFTAWFGGNNWGPRYVLPAVPLLAAAIGPWLDGLARWRKLLTAVLLALSVAVQALSIAVPHRIYSIAIASHGADLTQSFFYTRFAPVRAHARILLHKLRGGADVYTLRQLFDLDDDRPLHVTEHPHPSIGRFSHGFAHFAWVRVWQKGHRGATVAGLALCGLALVLGWRMARRPVLERRMPASALAHPFPSAMRSPNSDAST